MIPRYSRKQMTDIWEEQNRFEIWVKIEIAALEAMEKINIIPEGTATKVEKKASFDIDRINAIEKEIKHDVLAFLTNLSESHTFCPSGIFATQLSGTHFIKATSSGSGLELPCTTTSPKATYPSGGIGRHIVASISWQSTQPSPSPLLFHIFT